MAETNYDLERDLSEARAMAQGLDTYVRGDELFGSAGNSGPYLSDPDLPSLTLGALLTRLRRLQAQESRLTAAQKAILTEIETEHERVRNQWKEHYVRKLQREVTSRLQSISAFVGECEDDPVSCAGAYLPAAHDRTIVQDAIGALIDQNLPLADLDNAARREDSQLQRVTEPTDFLWSRELAPVYPKDTYWWLYARPRTHQ